MQSHRPIILHNLLPLSNSRFDSAISVGWNISTLSVNGLNEIQSNDGFQINPRDTNFSLRQNVSADPIANKAICAQRIDVTDLADVVGYHNGYLAAAAMFRATDSLAMKNSTLELKIYSTGSSTAGNGTEW